MHRARLAVVALTLPVLGGWHVGSMFDKAPGAGGGGGLFYTGSVRERGWDCTACHVDAPGQIEVDVRIEPDDFSRGRYVPGTVYALTVTLVEEKRGLKTGIANHNGLAVTVARPDLLPAGELGGYLPDEMYARGDNILATSGFLAGLTSWSFTWEAPDAETGEVGFTIGVVDGNGARTPPDVNITDPLGDDVWMGSWRLVPE